MLMVTTVDVSRMMMDMLISVLRDFSRHVTTDSMAIAGVSRTTLEREEALVLSVHPTTREAAVATTASACLIMLEMEV